MDVASPAPAPTGNAGTTNGAPNGASTTQTPAPKPAAKPNGERSHAAEPKSNGARDRNGRFVNQDSGTRKPEEADSGEPAKEPYRFKRRLKDGDKEEEVDYSEDDIAREVSIAKAAKRRLGELNQRMKELDEREAKLSAIEADPLAYLKERGQNPEEIAAKLLAQKAQRGLMSPEEQRIAQLEDENRAHQERWKRQEEEQKTAQRQALEAKQWEQEEPQYMAEIERLKLPKTMATLGFMARVGDELTKALGDGVTPQMVVAETHERLGRFAEHYVLSLPPEALVERLGPERMKAVQKVLADRWRRAQAAADPVPAVQLTAPPPPPDEARRFLTEVEVEERMRQARQRRGE